MKTRFRLFASEAKRDVSEASSSLRPWIIVASVPDADCESLRTVTAI